MKRLAVFLCAALVLVPGTVSSRPLPASLGAPEVGTKAPDFRLQEVGGKEVSLPDLISSGPKASWVLLVFYRGYW